LQISWPLHVGVMSRAQIVLADMLEISIHRLPQTVSGEGRDSFSTFFKNFIGHLQGHQANLVALGITTIAQYWPAYCCRGT